MIYEGPLLDTYILSLHNLFYLVDPSFGFVGYFIWNNKSKDDEVEMDTSIIDVNCESIGKEKEE